MAFASGTSFGAYTIVSPLGAGGMGEVYRARDTKLNRDVAIKFLPASFAAIPDRVSRFAREAQVLASLNHPHIAQIYGFEEAGAVTGGTGALVMEFVDGDELAQRIARGPIPPEDALAIARQIAEALEYAHERNVIHRDLKPANIKIASDGAVKVLDFGLAKALDPAAASPSAAALSPTVTSPVLTNLGVILGTAAYMSPEQAKGKAIDRRSDIWALGVVLFEMLTARPVFQGETVTDIIAQVMTQPPDWNVLPADTPAVVRRLLRRCLEKDPRNRFQSAGDVRLEIEEYLAAPFAQAAAGGRDARLRRSTQWLPWALCAVLAVALAGTTITRRSVRGTERQTIRLDAAIGTTAPMILDDNSDSALAVLSPDGQSLALLVSTDSARKLAVRPLSALQATVLPGTDGAWAQFFSPDGRWLAFFTHDGLKKIAVSGGAAVPIAATVNGRGGTWGPDDTIVFAPTTTSGLFRVPSSGGEAVPLTRLAPSDRSHRWPSFLPDGKAVLFARQQQNASYDDSTIEAVRLDSGATKVLVRGGTFPHYLSTGHLVYMRESTLFAVPFDAATLEVTGDPQPILGGILSSSGVGSGGGDGASQVSFAANGTMAYLSGTVTKDDTQLTIVDRTGKVSYTFPEQRRFKSPHFSSDGRRIAAEVDDGNTSNVYVIEPETNRFSRVTFLGPINGSPCWSPDGRRIAYFGSGAGGLVGLAITRSDGTGNPELLSNDRTIRIPTGFSPDGRTLLAIEQTAAGDFDVITLDVADKRRTPLVASPANEIGPVFSPDGRWIAYQSNESGRDEVYVRSFPAAEGKWQISTEGGQSPTWSKAGREIVYISGTASATRFMAADVSVQDGAIRASRPHRLFESSIARPPTASIYDTSADGSRFVFLKRVDSTAATEHSHVTIVVNVFDEVRRAFSAPSVR